jgi:hypothetical protein
VTLKVKIYFLVLLSVLTIVVLNEVNLSYISSNYPAKDGLITTADEPSYFNPPTNFLEHFNWSETAEGKPAYIRTPGYSIIYLVAKAISGSHAFLILKLIQLLFYAGSILFFSKILSVLSISDNRNLLLTSTYAVLPCFSGFVYYTLSESILPFFVLWSVYALMREQKKGFDWTVAVSMGFMVLIRPQMIILPLLFAIAGIKRNRIRSLSIFVGLLPLIAWQVRTYSIEGEWLGFHPIYSTKNNTLYRPPHEAMTDLFRVWDYRGDVFHANMALLSRDTLASTRQEVLATIPEKYHTSITPVLIEFQHFRNLQQTSYAGKELSTYLPGEEQLVAHINQTKAKLTRQYPLDNYVLTPFHSLKQLLGTSMMNLYIFQEPWRTNPIVIFLKYLSFFLIIAGLLAGKYLLFFQAKLSIRLLVMSVLLSIFYLSFIQRFNEERYLLPYLSLMLIFSSVVLDEFLKRIAQKKGS